MSIKHNFIAQFHLKVSMPPQMNYYNNFIKQVSWISQISNINGLNCHPSNDAFRPYSLVEPCSILHTLGQTDKTLHRKGDTRKIDDVNLREGGCYYLTIKKVLLICEGFIMTLWGHSKHYLGVYAMQFTFVNW